MRYSYSIHNNYICIADMGIMGNIIKHLSNVGDICNLAIKPHQQCYCRPFQSIFY